MRFLLHTTLSVFVLSSMAAGQVCEQAKPDQTTKWGGNHWITKKETTVYRSLEGLVTMWVDGPSMESALVEVFDQPAYLLCDFLPNNPNGCTTQPPVTQRRVAACLTRKSGKFKFPGLPAGAYELRVSRGSEWNVVHMYLRVNPKKGSGRSIKIGMTVGD